MALGLLTATLSWAATEPMPYDPIANVYPDSGVDQRVRDSLTLKPGRIRLNQAGYRTMDVTAGEAKFYYIGAALAFKVIDTTTKLQVGAGALAAKGFNSGTKFSVRASNWAGTVSGGDLRYTMSTDGLGSTIASSSVMEGTLPTTGLVEGGVYRIVVGADTSVSFLVSDNIYGMVRDGVLKFFGVNRSGFSNSWFHRPSHMKDGSLATPPNPGAYAGGWYDCGDHLKEPQTMSFALAMLSTIAATMPERDADHYGRSHANTIKTDGIPDMLYEAKHGADFFLNSWKLNGRSTGAGTGMITGVGDFGKDHGWWGRPENQDAMTETGRGGWKERILRSELGANTLGDVAAGLAILSKRWRPYDAKWADTALMAAKEMYTYAKANRVVVSSPAYNGAGADKVNANLALAATALLWVTRNPTYLNDIAYDKTIGSHGATWNSTGTPVPMLNSWEGGWMVMSNPNLTKGGANTDWANRHAVTLYTFYKLILADKDSALLYGVRNEAERQNLVTHTIAGVIQNLSSISGPSSAISIPLPSVDPNDGGGYAVRASSDWFVMFTQQEWVWNRYQVGNAAELYYYYDITRDLEAGLAGATLSGKSWNRAAVRQLMVRQMDYQLGENPWDVSMFMGLGKKNFNHPHHRGSNPEGRNTPGAAYQYHVPVGALYGAWDPTNATNANVQDFWNEYHTTEICLDGAATSVVIAAGLAADVPLNIPPKATVKVVYVSDTLAQIEVQLDKYGTSKLDYGLAPGTWIKQLSSDSAGVSKKYLIGGLKPATQYFFDVIATDLAGNSATYTKWDNPLPDGTPFSFTTKAVPSGPANIQNVKVCNVTADSAEIMWYTPDGEHQSSICWGKTAVQDASWTCAEDIDVTGHPTKFHYVKIGNLTEKTDYWFKVGSDGVWDDNGGANYKFRTPVRMANFSVYAVQYQWSGMPALAINVINNESRNYDSLSVRVYVRSQDTLKDALGNPLTHIKSTSTGLVNVPLLFKDAMAARYDICQAYDGAGFNKPCDDPSWGLSWSWSTLNRGVQMLPPTKMPETYDAATNSYVYFYDLPLGPTMMQQGSRIRFDVIFAARSEYSKNLSAGQLDLVNWVRDFVPTVPAYAVGDTGWYDALDAPLAAHPMGKTTQDWSFMAHSVSAGDPVDFIGIPAVANQTAANALIDNLSDQVPFNPYMTVYRKGEFVYGFSPSYIEQATKKTYWGAEVKFDAPFDIPYGNTIVLDKPTSTIRVKGTANIFDKLTPAAKGVITDIWVNGSRLTNAQMATAAIQDPVTKLWKLDIPVKMDVGGNNVDITIFGGSGVCPDTATTCENGCAFVNGAWFVQFTKGKSSTSTIAYLDPTTLVPLTTDLVPDSSKVVVEIRDNDNNLTRGTPDVVRVLLKSGTGSVYVSLTETGDSTGIFRSAPVSISTIAGWTTTSVSPKGGDTLTASYLDANDPEDSSNVKLRIKSLWPTPLRGGIFRGCDGSYSARVLFDRAFPGSSMGPELVLNGGFETPAGTKTGIQIDGAGTFGAWIVNNIDVVHSTILPTAAGTQSLDLNNTGRGNISQTLATTAGQKLSLRFQYSWNNWSSDADPSKEAVVLWNGVVIDTIRPVGSVRIWIPKTYSLTASGSDVLGFKSTGGIAFGIMLDEVSVRALSGTASLGPDTVILRKSATDTLLVAVPGSSTSLDAAGTTLTIPLALVPDNGARTGRAIISIPDGNGGYKMVGQALSDSVGPWLDSAKIVENLEGRLVDTVALWVSEPVVAPAKAWFLDVTRAGSSIPAASIVVDSAWLADPSTGRWTVVVRSGVLQSGDQLQLTPAKVADLKGNPASSCPAPKELKLWVRQAPISQAWIRDANGDGTADQVVVVYKRALRAGEAPTSIRVRFGAADSVRDVVVSPVAGDSVVRIDLPLPYSRGTTSGSSSTGAGNLVLLKAGDSTSVALEDSVGPGLLSAKLLYGAVSTDTVLLSFSERVSSIAGTSWVQILKAAATNLGLVGNPIEVDPWTWKIVVDTASIVPGDSIRPNASGRFVDATGRSAAVLHPWIEVQGDDRPPAKAWYSDVDGDGAVDYVTMMWARAPRTQPSFLLLWPSITGGFDTVRVAATSWVLQADGKTAIFPVGPFDRGVTSSPTTDLGRQISNGSTARFPIFDSVPPVMLSARLSYGTSSADTVRVTFSEAVSIDLATTGTIKSGSAGPLRFVSQALSADGLQWTIPVDTLAVFPGDSVKPTSVIGFSDASGNRPSVLHPWVVVAGAERPPQIGWYEDQDGDGAVDHVTVVWSHGPRTRPTLAFLWPNGVGGMDSDTVSGAWTLQPDGLTAVFAIGPFAQGVTSAPTTDLGRQNSSGTITAFPIVDRVPAVMTRARVGYASVAGEYDTLQLSWSEPIRWTGLNPLAMVRSGTGVSAIVGKSTILDADSTGAIILLDPVDSLLTVFRSGDHVRLAPASAGTLTDRLGNAVEDPTVWVRVTLGRRPPRFDVVFDPNKLKYKDWVVQPGPAMQIYVRSATDTRWTNFDTKEVVGADNLVPYGLGPVISLNQPLRGKAILYDNQGTFVANVDLDLLGEAFLAGDIPVDGSNQYQVRIHWNGTSANGKLAASGVYILRLVLWQNTAGEDEEPDWVVVNKVYRCGWEIAPK